ncbi:phospholipid transporting ATPase IF [Echinococcus multilocularis]|uniref:Phospholipid-transporting ATPase n=1 Tax=Echinococcus multilocularis TaxID=6211 RepID=A0A087VXM0_ECHMU|nr:phospholipid transporting ATPase IF [Echinococcus multilocularis]
MFKEGYEDLLRHRADQENNHKPIEVVDETGALVTKRSFELVVGDIVLVCNGDTFPCDIVVLSSSESSGECFVTTASLDGETNLKRLYAPPITREMDNPSDIAKSLLATIVCQQPVQDIYEFTGQIIVSKAVSGTESTHSLNSECLLLRGARLHNTDFIYGCVVYTGHDTKMSLNTKKKKAKFSQVERRLNTFLLLYLLGLLLICVAYTVLKNLFKVRAWYIHSRKITPWYVTQDLLAFIVLFNHAVPISLYVTMELQKFIGSMFFGCDLELYDAEIDERALVNTSDILEEMGQIEYLFSDKTGTLTKNEMSFQRLAVADGTFLLRDSMLHPLYEVQATRMHDLRSPRFSGAGLSSTKMPMTVQILLIFLALCHTVRVEQDPDARHSLGITLMEYMKKQKRLKRRMKGGFKLMTSSKVAPPSKEWTYRRRESAILSAQEAVCAVNRGSEIDSGEDYEYQASSPDEKAFVEGCRDLGIIYHGQNKRQLQVVTLFGRRGLQYRLLDVLEFDANRKCMSVIVQPVLQGEDETPDYVPEKPALVLCKGADSSILAKSAPLESLPTLPELMGDPLLDGLFAPSEEVQTQAALSNNRVCENVTKLASFGLRTLVEGVRLLKPAEWLPLQQELNEARTNMEDKAGALAKAYQSIERDLMLIGCTGVEDKLQDDVPETLIALRQAGIQIWVLTGDKEETAVNVSFLSGHFGPGLSTIHVTKQNNLLECSLTLQTQLNSIERTRQESIRLHYGLVVDGQSLNFALQATQKHKFLLLCREADAVLCCRLTPIQKAEVVRVVKHSRSPPPITCAIGDGANDVSMILEAHVGIGLFGKEGRQAARASDYVIGKFRFLKRTLLFHGCNFYWRTANVVLYFFYKNLVFVLTQAYFGVFSNFATQTAFSSLYLLSYNVIVTSSPIIIYGILEMPFPEEVLQDTPLIYTTLSRNRLLSWKNFVVWNAFGLWHSIVLFFGCYILATEGVSRPGGAIESLHGFGSMLFSFIFLVVTIKLLLITYSLNALLLLTIGGTVLVTYTVLVLLSYVAIPVSGGRDLLGVWENLLRGPSAMINLFGHALLLVLALAPDIVYRVYVDSCRVLPASRGGSLRGIETGAKSGSVRRPLLPHSISKREVHPTSLAYSSTSC